MSDQLTNQELEVLYAMNKGMYAMIFLKREGISTQGYSITQMIKAGTIKKLLSLGLIEPSKQNNQRFLLTEEGRKFKQP